MSDSQPPLSPRLLDMLQDIAARQPDRPALVHLADPLDMAPRIVTYAELVTTIERVAAGLQEAGVLPQQSVAILSPTTPDSLVAFVASATVAAAFPINPLLAPAALAQQLELAQARTCVIHGPDPLAPLRDKLLAALQISQSIETVVEIETPFAAEEPFPGAIRRVAWQSLLDAAGSPLAVEADSRRVAALFHTGGTSGNPKLAELGDSALAAGPQLAAAACNWQPHDRVLNFLPHFHVGGTLSITLAALSRGGAIYTCGRLGGRDPELASQIWTLCANHDITIPTMVPTSWSAVLENAAGSPPASLRGVMTGGAAAPVELVERVEAVTRVPMSQVYGMTEMAGICTAQPVDGVFRPHAVGFAPPGMSVELEPIGDELNEVRVSGPNLFYGYRTTEGRIGEPGARLATGDLGELDDSGQLRLLGRSKDVIIRSGHNIDPTTIEEAAYEHPGIVHAAAVGLPDAYAGEVPVLFIVPAEGADLSDLESFLADNISEAPARPRRIIPIDTLPLTPVGKIERYRLRQRTAVLRAGELLDDLPVESIRCDDPAARNLDICWPGGTQDDIPVRADERLGKVGLRASHGVSGESPDRRPV